MSEAEVPIEIQDMAEQIYRFLVYKLSDSTITWYSPGVIRMMMGIPQHQEILFMKGFWWLYIQGIVETNTKGIGTGSSYRLSGL